MLNVVVSGSVNCTPVHRLISKFEEKKKETGQPERKNADKRQTLGSNSSYPFLIALSEAFEIAGQRATFPIQLLRKHNRTVELADQIAQPFAN